MNVRHRRGGPGGEAEEKDPKKEKGGLPDGWEETKDEQGTTYYYNKDTGETTYDDPKRAASAGPRGGVRMFYEHQAKEAAAAASPRLEVGEAGAEDVGDAGARS